MLDRMGLSLKNGWLDKENRVFIYFTLEDLQEYMNCGHNKGIKIMAELDNIGLIERVKQGLGRPTIIYVKRFSTDTVNSPAPEEPPNVSFQQDYPQGTSDFRKAETQTSSKGKLIRMNLIILSLIKMVLVILSYLISNRENQHLIHYIMDRIWMGWLREIHTVN